MSETPRQLAISADPPATTEPERADRRSGTSASPKPEPRGLIHTAVRGYREGSSVERGALGMLASFAVTIGASRLTNYVRERRRHAPRLRSWGRHAYHLPGREELRVHHFVPGVGLAFLAGAGAIIKREDRLEPWFSVPFGIGMGLTFDEIALMTELDNPYWESEKLALAQAASAALGATALALRLHHRAARGP